ncbi:MAG: energy transducer TonB [Flavobacteriaceae bacterium]
MLPNKKNPGLEVGRNSSLYFAIGLNLMLFLSWRALEYRTYEKDEIAIDVVEMEARYEEEIPIVQMQNLPPPPPPPAVITQAVEIVDDMEEIEETVIESTETNQAEAIADYAPVEVGDIAVEAYEEDVQVAFAVIEDVPVFPGCEKLSKAATKKCFQDKIQEHIRDNFKYPETALELGIQGRVSVMFIIDSKGVTTNVRSRGPDKLLEKEAERIIGLLPKMEPGKQRGRPVKVAYAVPIFFKFHEG